MRKFLPLILSLAIITGGYLIYQKYTQLSPTETVAFGAVAVPSYTPTLAPITDNTYYLGTTSPQKRYKGLFLATSTAGCAAFSTLGEVYSNGSSCGGGSGEVNTGNSLGTGLNLYDSKTGVVLNFNSLSAGSNITLSTSTNNNTIVISSSGSGAGDSFTHPASGKSATTSELQITGGLLSTGSTTISSNLFLTSLSQGGLYTGSNGLVGTFATGTVSAGSSAITVTAGRSAIGGALAIDCATAGSGQNGCLSSTDWSTFNGKLGSYDAWTHPAAGQSATTSLMLLYGQASSTEFSANSGYFNYINATTTTATSSIIHTLRLGTSVTGQNLVSVVAPSGKAYSNSVSTGGLVNITNTNSTGAGLVIYSNQASPTGRLLAITDDNASSAQQALFVDEDGTNAAGLFNCDGTSGSVNECLVVTSTKTDRSAFGVSGAPSGLGLNKLTFNGVGTSNSSMQSMDASVANYVGQGLFIDSSGGGWAGSKILNLRANGTEYLTLLTEGQLGLGTTTPKWSLNIASSTGPQIALSDTSSTANPWVIRGVAGAFYIATASPSTFATSSVFTPFSISSSGTTTLAGLSVVSSPTNGTSTSNVGWNITTGCYAISGTCIGGSSSGSGLTSYDAFTHPYLSASATTTIIGIGTSTPLSAYQTTIGSSTAPQLALSANTAGIPHWAFANEGGNLYISSSTAQGIATTSISALSIIGSTGKVGIATDTPFSTLSIGTSAGVSPFTIGSSTATYLTVDLNGKVGIGTAYPTLVNANSRLTVANTGAVDIIASSTDNTTLSTAIIESYAPGSRTFIGAHGTNQVVTQYGITLGGWGELGSIDSSFGTSNGLLIGTRTGNKPIVFGTNSLERVRVSETGSVGIGTTTPKWQLNIASTTGPQIGLTGDNANNIWTMRSIGNTFSIATASPITWATSTQDAFKITANGTTTLTGLNILNGTGTSSSAVGWNITGGCFAIAGTCIGGSGGSGTVTSVGLAMPTGFTITNSPVTTSGTLTATIQSNGYSVRKLPSYIVAAAGGDFTTIQGALDQCGTDGGGNIYLTDKTYAQAGTGLTFKGSNCNIYGRDATTTITFTGATTGFKTNSAAGVYSHNGIHHVVITGDANASGVAIDGSDMSHNIYDDIKIDSFARGFKLNDTQNVTFYNLIQNNDLTTISVMGIDASSTNPVNANIFQNNFIGCTSNNCIAIQLNNANGNKFENNYLEPDGTKTGVVGYKLFDNTLATNNGVFNNSFSNDYIEGGLVAGTIGISGATAIGPSGGIQRNIFTNETVENNTTDWSLTSTFQSLNTFIGGYNSNFTIPLTSLQGPVGISTSTQMQSIGTTPFAFFGINPTAGVASNQFVVGSSTATNFIINNSGKVGLGTTTPGTILSIGNTNGINFSNTATSTWNVSQAGINLANGGCFAIAGTCIGGGSGSGLSSYDAWAHPLTGFSATTSSIVVGTSTTGIFGLTSASSTKPQLALSAGAGFGQWVFRNAGGSLYIATTTIDGTATTTQTALTLTKDSYAGFGTTTPFALLQIATTSTAGFRPQLALTDMSGPVGGKSWTLDSFAGTFSISSTSDTTYATATALSISAQSTSQWGFGTSSPWADFSINPVVGGQVAQFVVGSSTKTNFIIDNAGRVGIGTTTPTAQLAVGTTTAGNMMIVGTSTYAFLINGAGNIYAPLTSASGASQTGYWCYDASGQLIRDTAVCLVSARKFKTDIQPLDVGLTDLLKLEPVSYYYKDKSFGAGQQMGLIADDVANNPRLDAMLVTRDNNGDVHGFNYNTFTALITQSIKDFYSQFQKLIARVSGLEKKVENQQKQIDTLNARLDKLEK